MIKLVYKPVSILVSVLGGILAGALVKAVLERGTADAARKLTGYWPGENSEPDPPQENG